MQVGSQIHSQGPLNPRETVPSTHSIRDFVGPTECLHALKKRNHYSRQESRNESSLYPSDHNTLHYSLSYFFLIYLYIICAVDKTLLSKLMHLDRSDIKIILSSVFIVSICFHAMATDMTRVL